MYLKNLSLQNFRSYKNAHFEFDPKTIIVGPNTSGKTNIIESVTLLTNGKSFKTDKDTQMLRYGESIGRVKGEIGETALEVVLTPGEVEGKKIPTRKYFVNGVSKRRPDFIGNLVSISFSPLDLMVVIGQPSARRKFMDEVLEQTDFDYRVALIEYEKGIRQRNSLLELARKTGGRDLRQFEYWDNLVIKHGTILNEKREAFVSYLNSKSKDIFEFAAIYDKSLISYERLLEYQEEESLAGVTLVGPHRDDLVFDMFDEETKTAKDIKFYGSRGQQRLTILQLKLLQLLYIEEKSKISPLLLLDDIFSELDERHIIHVLKMLGDRESIITTTHLEFIPPEFRKEIKVIQLQKNESPK